ncbi:hypothetical protein [Nocardiopsis sp. FR26]|uniref:hypothetical protein n=1 Tax=Nocardiopsis sp. FR26 TaxID=2605987 RepID=UPI0013575B37|nr:hypothetical protein [Nocardiopsis sp. FR26]
MSWRPASDITPDAPHITHTWAPEPAAWTNGPADLTTNALRGFTREQDLAATAYHEAGHAVVFTICGIAVDRIGFGDIAGLAGTTHLGRGPHPVSALLTGLSAGWRAEIRWLTESGLHTPERAWAAERHAGTDQRAADALCREAFGEPLQYGKGPTHADWASASEAADTILGVRWGAVALLAEELVNRWLDSDYVMPGRQVHEFALS